VRTISRALAASPWDMPGALYAEEHRMLVAILEERHDVGSDEALRDVARVGRRLGELGLYRELLPKPRRSAPKGEKPEERVDVRALCAVREVLAYWSPLADAVFAVQGLCANPLLSAGRRDVVDAMVSGQKIGGFALTEPEAGSDVAAMKTTAKKDGDSWVLDGHKTLISNVGIAHHFVVFANANPSAGRKGISAFLVDAATEGLEARRIELSGDHPLGGLVMHGCRVPASALLGEVGQGLRLALGTLEVYRTSVGAAALGMAWRAIDETLRHVTTREQFGGKLCELQLVQAAIADMVTELQAARLLVAEVARLKSETRKKNVGADVAMAKMHATEAAQRIIDRAVQLHGGIGVVSGSKVEELYREIRPLRIYEGATDVLRLIVGSSLVKAHAEPA
jgi:acyl-CoA dehydrogenase